MYVRCSVDFSAGAILVFQWIGLNCREVGFSRGESSRRRWKWANRETTFLRARAPRYSSVIYPVVHDCRTAVPEGPNTRPSRLQGSIINLLLY
jgi:hypothetical protein